MQLRLDPESGAILFRHPTLRGIPDLVVEGDGYTMEFIGPTLLCLDIQDPSGMARLLAEPIKGKQSAIAPQSPELLLLPDWLHGSDDCPLH